MTKFISVLVPDYCRPDFHTGYNAAHDDALDTPPHPSADFVSHSCPQLKRDLLLLRGETCQHCGATVGLYMPREILLAGGGSITIHCPADNLSVTSEGKEYILAGGDNSHAP